MADFGLREMSAMAVLVIALLWIGLFPQGVLDLASPAVNGVEALFQQSLPVEVVAR
jgi:NADH-quinone oxidoreductase subunit M